MKIKSFSVENNYPRLETLCNSKNNNLNAVRLFLALLVLWSHCIPLTMGMIEKNKYPIQDGSGSVAVNIFFFISGLLITASWMRSKCMEDYLRKRIFRIYPAYIVAFIFSIVIATIACPSLPQKILTGPGIIALLHDLAYLSQGTILNAHMFPHNPVPFVVNGSIWTIPIEFQCYLFVCVLGMLRLFKIRWFMILIFLCSYVLLCRAILMEQAFGSLDRRFITYFTAGICAWLWREKIVVCTSGALIMVGIVLINYLSGASLHLLEPFTITYLVLYIGYFKPIDACRWCDKTDLSYGVYLYAFPIQQLVALSEWGRNYNVMFLVTTPVCLLFAFASWHLVEKWFLKMKPVHIIHKDDVVQVSALSVNA